MAKAQLMKKNSMIKVAVQKLQRSISLKGAKCNYANCIAADVHDIKFVPQDVKEGHFAVLAVYGEKPKRFVVSLRCLTNPTFLRLLEMAEEEFGFRQEGAIALPCRPCELERIISEL